MKKLGKLMLMLTVITALLCVFALHSSAATYSGTCGSSVNWSLDTETGVMNITGTGNMWNYVYYPENMRSPWFSFSSMIKSIAIQNGVQKIGEGAFARCENLMTVTFPNSVTEIDESAFASCASLTSITIPSSVTSIGSGAFSNCGSLASINVDSANAHYVSVDGVLFNKGKTELIAYPAGKTATSYVIPIGVTVIESDAFRSCKNLTRVTISSSVTSIGSFAFEECEKLTNVSIQNGVTSIYNGAFYGCSSLTSLTIPSSVIEIPYDICGVCCSLTSINVDSANPEYVSVDGVLFNKSKTTLLSYPAGKTNKRYVIPDSVTSIECTFEKCSNLKSLTIPSSMTAIESYQFYGLDGLTDITIPTSVKEIGAFAFEGCNNLKNVFYAGSQAQWNEIAIMENNDKLISATIYYNSTGHSWDSGTVTKIATCTADGEKVYKCTVPGCNDTKKEVIVKSGHSFTKKTTTKTYLKSAAGCNNAAVYYYCCSRCSAKGTKTFTSGKALGHTYKTTTTKATTSKDGATIKKCTVCGKQASKTVIYKATTFTLSTKTYTFDGKIKSPSVTVRDSKGKALKRDVDFTVTYPSNRSSVGVHNITVTFKGNYSGKKTLSFTIIPKATGEIRVTQTTTSVKATWAKVTGATGYKVYIYKGSKLVASKTVSSKTTSYTFKKLTAGTGYTVKVKTYQTVSKVNYWSSTESLETATKPATPSMKSVKAGSKSATVKWSNISGENGYQVYYATSKNGTYKKGATTKANDVDATIKKLTKGKTYYFKVRAYKTADSGTVYSAWSAVKSVKVK